MECNLDSFMFKVHIIDGDDQQVKEEDGNTCKEFLFVDVSGIKQEPSESEQEAIQFEASAVNDVHGEAVTRCLICHLDTSDVTKDSLFKRICDFCCTKVYKDNHEKFLNADISSCKICFNSLAAGVELIRHDCTRSGMYICYYCDRRYMEKHYLKLHFKNRQLKFSCSECNLSFCYLNEFHDHNSVVHGRKTDYTCSSCREGFRSLSKLKKHVSRMHSKLDTDCGKGVVDNRRSFMSHVGVGNKKRYACTYCSKEFEDQHNCKRHVNIHTQEKLYTCTYCQKQMTDQSALKRHINSHTKENLYRCPFCPKVFTYRSTLKSHLNFHTKEKSYNCTYCSKVFGTQSNFKRHVNVHTRSKLYTCTHCPKKFTDQSYLKKHINWHTKEILYCCTYCSKEFTDKTILKTHVKIHMKEKPFKCTYCPKEFMKERLFISHVNTHTKDKVLFVNFIVE